MNFTDERAGTYSYTDEEFLEEGELFNQIIRISPPRFPALRLRTFMEGKQQANLEKKKKEYSGDETSNRKFQLVSRNDKIIDTSTPEQLFPGIPTPPGTHCEHESSTLALDHSHYTT